MKGKKIGGFVFNFYKRLMDIKNDNKGSILPMIAVVLILVIILGAVNYSLVVMYRDRARVRNALDAGVTSSLAAATVEKEMPIFFGEELVTINQQYVECIMFEPIEPGWRDENGLLQYDYEKVDKSKTVPTLQEWVDTEAGFKNYIQYDVGGGTGIAQLYFNENIEGNFSNYNLINFSISVTYDDKRIYTVIKERDVLRKDITGTLPSGANCDFGKPTILNKVTSPPEWWASDFAGADTGVWIPPPGWTTAIYEERDIIFPRWVEVKATVTVEMPVPLGKLVGMETYRASFDIRAFKELKNPTP